MPSDVVAAGQLARIAGVAQLLKLHALDDLTVAHVEARDDAFGQHACPAGAFGEGGPQTWRKLRRICSPASPDFSGWNCTPKMLSRSTTEENVLACSVDATHSSVTGAAYECVKYTCAPEDSPWKQARRPHRNSSAFQPTCGILSRRSGSFCSLRDLAANDAESLDLRRFVAALEQPLHAEADPEQRVTGLRRGLDGLQPLALERRRRGEVADTRDDDARGLAAHRRWTRER